MGNYTEADVEKWWGEALAGVDCTDPAICAKAGSAMLKLKAAALEGAKVPGLVADNAALLAAGLRWAEDASDPLVALALESALRAEHPGAALLAELEDVRAAWHRETTRADALQARVRELEREFEEQTYRAECIADTLDCDTKDAPAGVESLKAERDTLRAQVEDLKTKIRRLRGHRETVEGLPAGTLTNLPVLSAPPAVTTLQRNLARDPRFQCAVHTDCFGDSEYCTKGN